MESPTVLPEQRRENDRWLTFKLAKGGSKLNQRMAHFQIDVYKQDELIDIILQVASG